MFFSFFFVLCLYFKECEAQFFEAESPWQFAGYAVINIPATDNNAISSYIPQYSPFQQQLQLQQYSSANRFEQQQQQQQQQQLQQLQQLQQQSLIQSPHNRPLLPSVISIPKRENGNSLKLENEKIEHEKERQQGELPEFSRGGSTLEHATYLSLINDKDNFQASGCGWDLIRLQCHDLFGLCKGGCRDFAIAINSPIHDCRCIPFGYLALVKLAGK